MDPVTVEYDPIPSLQARCIKQLGKDEGELFFFLWERSMELQTLWEELQIILNSTVEQTALLQKHIPRFCRIATDSMWRELITSIVAYGDGNLLVKTNYAGLPELLRTLPEANQPKGFVLLNEFRGKTKPLLRMRHTHVSHFSRKAIGLRTVHSITQEEIAIGMEGIKTVLSAYCRLVNFPYPSLEAVAAEKGGAKSLLSILKKHEDGIPPRLKEEQ